MKNKKIFKTRPNLKAKNILFNEEHLAFFKNEGEVPNASEFVRWLMDNSELFQKYKKEKGCSLDL